VTPRIAWGCSLTGHFVRFAVESIARKASRLLASGGPGEGLASRAVHLNKYLKIN
jgi:hypothetical protein